MARKNRHTQRSLEPRPAGLDHRDGRPDDRAPGRVPVDPRRGAGSGFLGEGRTADLVVVLAIAIVCFAVYSTSLAGKFVYDDERQIVVNTLIQDSRYFWKAMTSDVWAFKGAGEDAISNYWRPAFVLWLIVNYRLFGLGSTIGWHVLNVLLHALVCALVYALARRLDLARSVAAAIALLFAVHPVHVESVAWISGSPDLLLATGLLGALLLVLSTRRRPSIWAWGGALALYTLAQLSKEVAIFFPVIVFVAIATAPSPGGRRSSERLKAAVLAAVPFTAIAVVYFAARLAVVGKVSRNVESASGLAGILLTAPSIAAFYLRQIVFPWWIGPSYPLRPIHPESFDLASVVLPALVAAAAGIGALILARKSRSAALGAALLALPLVPAFNIDAFLPEHIVHDRYLYLPLLGALLIVVPPLAGLLARRAGWAILAAAAAISVPLSVQTARYGRAWTDNLALWEWGTVTDPGSSVAHAMLGTYLRSAGRLPEARAAYDRALAITAVTSAYLGRAEISTSEKRFAEAEADLRQVLKAYPDNFQAWERLAVCYERQGRLEDAARALREARAKIPAKQCTLTEMLSIVLYRAGRKSEAVSELESVRGKVRGEYDPSARNVLYRLGLLHEEAGRKDEAGSAFREFLDLTRDLQDPPTLRIRGEVQKALLRLSPNVGGAARP